MGTYFGTILLGGLALLLFSAMLFNAHALSRV